MKKTQFHSKRSEQSVVFDSPAQYHAVSLPSPLTTMHRCGMTVPGEKGGLQHMNHDSPSPPDTISVLVVEPGRKNMKPRCADHDQ